MEKKKKKKIKGNENEFLVGIRYNTEWKELQILGIMIWRQSF